MGKRDIEKGGGGEQSKGSVWIARGGGLSATAISVEGAPRERERLQILLIGGAIKMKFYHTNTKTESYSK